MQSKLFKTTLRLVAALATTVLLTAQDPAARFNGTWKGEEGGQTRKLTYKEGVVYMEEIQPNGRIILRNYPTKGQEITMTEGVWKDSKATGKMDGNKLVVETTMPKGTKWHDEWTIAGDGKSYTALRQMVAAGDDFARPAGAAPPPPANTGTPKAPTATKNGSSNVPELFVRVE
jgi:hypothetical protein